METSTIQKDENLVLKSLAAETADTAGTSINVGPLGLCKVSLVNTAGFATGTLTISIQESDDDGSVDHWVHTENQLAISPVIAGAAANAGAILWEAHIVSKKAYIRYASTHEAASGAVSKTYQVLISPKDV